MLARLSIRDIVLIERLDIEFSRGLAVLTGETGAGKSILLDAFALALGGRGDAGLVRHGAEQGQVTAMFDVPKGHPAAKILAENGLDDTGEMILRRVQLADGRTRAFINDQAISVQTLKAVGAVLVEIHGQHDDRGLLNARGHRALLDAFGRIDAGATATAYKAWRDAEAALATARATIDTAARDREWLEHAVAELRAAGIDVAADQEWGISPAAVAGRGTSDDYDDLWSDGSAGAFNGDMRVCSHLPNSDGGASQWTPSTGTAHYACVDDATPGGDTDYVSDATAGHRDTYGFPALPVGSSATVKAVQVRMWARKDDAGTRTIDAVARIGGTNYDNGSALALSTSYSAQEARYLTDPSTGSAWTVSGVNGAELGVKEVA